MTGLTTNLCCVVDMPFVFVRCILCEIVSFSHSIELCGKLLALIVRADAAHTPRGERRCAAIGPHGVACASIYRREERTRYCARRRDAL